MCWCCLSSPVCFSQPYHVPDAVYRYPCFFLCLWVSACLSPSLDAWSTTFCHCSFSRINANSIHVLCLVLWCPKASQSTPSSPSSPINLQAAEEPSPRRQVTLPTSTYSFPSPVIRTKAWPRSDICFPAVPVSSMQSAPRTEPWSRAMCE